MHIVLVEPEIPGNTGNIARLCAATGASLHLVKPLGFSIEDRYLKRAGLDYWHLVDVTCHEKFSDVERLFTGNHFYFNTTKATKRHTDVRYQPNDLIVFGKETAGLPQELLDRNPEACIRIPMRADARSLNLSNAAAIVLFEALRQFEFAGLV